MGKKVFPKSISSTLRRNRVKPTTATLIPYTLNEIDTIAVCIADLEYNRLHGFPAVKQLAVDERVQFDVCLQLITRKQVDNRLSKLNCSLNHSPEPAALPTNPHSTTACAEGDRASKTVIDQWRRHLVKPTIIMQTIRQV
ncbi:hypothetical protein EG68_01364 [Paragonimus skrjabini miyazakii]|uniref:Uncharacterized protein n=1 Tax=Paragonimus skrjabini miyazakii TaxID=59628 RepID=A0A8S9ZBZ9_9TREM|nr:hypothetical protein EG68_01364 [Paragonimus skrjabini miyazakii]